MGKHSKNKKRRYSSESEDKLQRNKVKKTEDLSVESEEINLINFSFLDYKNELTDVLTGYSPREQLIENVNDFWLFVNKYETLLKRSGKPILPKPINYKNIPESIIVPQEYNKIYTSNLQLAIPFDELYTRISTHRYGGGSSSGMNINENKLRHFLQIVHHYLDFKQKEKFSKLKKLKKVQENLPVHKMKEEIIGAVKNNQVVIIAGDTGCGKSTQVPQYLYQAGFQNIACTQPRRIACVSLSKRVAHEMLCEYGLEVGYQIRFERRKNKHTKILFLTEGLLLRQLSSEETQLPYDIIVFDEIHERHLHGDFLLGISKCLLKARPDLKLILMSATINIELFCNYFSYENAHIIEVPGRLYPIKLHYLPQLQDVPDCYGKSKTAHLSPEPFIQIMQRIDSQYPPTEKGDLLVFVSGLNEITTIVDAATQYNEKNKSWIILPLHSSLSIADQDKVFDYAPDGIRKCIVSTNIAETSITIDGIRFVVDSGKVKEMSYDSSSKMQRLKEFWISKASAEQRKGRAGRTGPGVCYRLYGEKEYNSLESYSAAEIHRVPLESLLLQMISMGLPNARLFPFIEPPPLESIEHSILSLKQHEALTIEEKLTPIGKALVKLPVDISIGKMLLMGCVFRQLQPVLTLAAALSVQTPFTNRAYRDPECENARKQLESDHGDPFTLMNAYKEWLELKQAGFDRRGHTENTKTWCRRRGLEEQRFYEITKLRNQFQDLLNDCGLIELNKNESKSSSERAIRHGELRQLKELRRQHKMQEPRRRKLLKSDSWGLETEDDHLENDGSTDIRDIEFRLSHDTSKMQNLVSGATACSYRDLMTLKLILVSGLYPQTAIPDEFNYCKSTSQHFFHTQSKPFASLHPLSFFGNNADILQLTETEIIQKPPSYKSKLPLSSKHQILCYLNLLETTKPYLINTIRMPAAQTLLLFAHTIDTNLTFSRIVCDSWLCLDFPFPGAGQTILQKVSKLRRSWNKLLASKLESLNQSVESDKSKQEKSKSMEELEYNLWQNLASFMHIDILYTIKRLLPADIKNLYIGPSAVIEIKSNPFAEEFECNPNSLKGGVFITENITYGCIVESEWSLELHDEILNQTFDCSICGQQFTYLTGFEQLQHSHECLKLSESKKNESITTEDENKGKPSTNQKKYECKVCDRIYYFTNIEILKHKNKCK